jgi:hypothetical protein
VSARSAGGTRRAAGEDVITRAFVGARADGVQIAAVYHHLPLPGGAMV